MSIVCDIITCLAFFALMAGFSMIDKYPVLGFLLLFISGIWIAINIAAYDEKRMRGGR